MLNKILNESVCIRMIQLKFLNMLFFYFLKKRNFFALQKHNNIIVIMPLYYSDPSFFFLLILNKLEVQNRGEIFHDCFETYKMKGVSIKMLIPIVVTVSHSIAWWWYKISCLMLINIFQGLCVSFADKCQSTNNN